MVFDIGGTNLRGARYSPVADSIDSPVVVPTPNRILYPELSAVQLYEKLLEAIVAVGDKLGGENVFSAVSIAFPGPVDSNGRLMAAPGIWGMNPDGPIDMIDDIKQLWPDLTIFLCNDLTAAGFRYVEMGTESFCLVTVSTGVGSKVFIQGQPQLGPNGLGGEIGHVKVLFTQKAPICDCGDRGHLQAVSSGRGVLALIQQQARKKPDCFKTSILGKIVTDPKMVSNRFIAEAFRSGDPFTVKIIQHSISPLATILVNLYLALGLERFIIIGGFALALGEPYRLDLVRQAAALCWNRQADWNGMIQFGFEDDLAGLIGAGRLARREISVVE
jgi:glucokinase